jgi:hypothetical protein
LIAPNNHPETTIRGQAIERLIRVAQALQRVRFGASLSSIRNEVNEEMGMSYSDRTFHRDLRLLEAVRLVQLTVGPFQPTTARWIGEGGFFEQPATAMRMAYDRVAQTNSGGSYSWSRAARGES